MNIAITVVAILLVIYGAFSARRAIDRRDVEPEVQRLEATAAPTPEDEAETPTRAPTTQPTPKPTTPPAVNQGEFQYPGSTRVGSDDETVTYQSQDDSDRITDWYEEKIRSLGMNAKSFVKTRTNDNVLNKLVGADGSREVRVEISKPAASSTVTIKVSITED